MAPSAAPGTHHHRSTTKQSHKPFKSKHASKGAIKDLNKGEQRGVESEQYDTPGLRALTTRILAGKVERSERGSRKTPHQQLQTKLDRRNQAKQKQRLKHKGRSEAASIFAGVNGAPRQVAVIPLAEGVDTRAAVRSLNESVDVQTGDQDAVATAEGLEQRRTQRVRIERFKQNVTYIPVDGMDLLAAMDAARVADFVVFVLPPDDTALDEQTQLFLRAIEGQGISTTFAVVQGLDGALETPKKRQQMLALLKSYMIYFFPTMEKITSLDSRQECANLVRGLATATPRGVHWRDDRSYMLIDEVRWAEETVAPVEGQEQEGPTASVAVTGVIRGRNLKADRLVHLPGWGDYQIASIVAAPYTTTATQRKARKNGGEAMNVDEQDGPQILDEPSADADDLNAVAPEDLDMDDEDEEAYHERRLASAMEKEKKGVLLDDHHYFSEEEGEEQVKHLKLPKGTSTYQSAWYLDDVSDSDVSDEEEEGDGADQAMMEADDTEPLGPEDGNFDRATAGAPTTVAPSEYPQSELFNDRSLEEEAEELARYRASRKSEAEEDLEFPDEIELHPNVSARERLARYRGLKNLRTSVWDTDKDRPHEPQDWRRLLQVVDYRGSRAACVREALVGGVAVGTRVRVTLRAVPLAKRQLAQPLALFGLLRHEHKQSVCNVSMALNAAVYDRPLRSKEEVVLQIGPRRLVVNPVFSAGDNTPNDVHKFDRFLHPGRAAVASYIGPISWGAMPVLVFRQTNPAGPRQHDEDAMVDDDAAEAPALTPAAPSLTLIGSGTTLPPSHSRVIAKRVILTGHPFKIHKRVVTVRYMFFNTEDVAWFKALQLWTKRGRTGFIKESLGTHGYFKAMFDAKISAQDVIGMSLYKRVFPRKARDWVA
ncbi:hypothetical protein KEM52_005983 [Ascosphaera acerosa]|nr:hypothetical protein KEM52_005983 [Ascosphaera acerosa]